MTQFFTELIKTFAGDGLAIHVQILKSGEGPGLRTLLVPHKKKTNTGRAVCRDPCWNSSIVTALSYRCLHRTDDIARDSGWVSKWLDVWSQSIHLECYYWLREERLPFEITASKSRNRSTCRVAYSSSGVSVSPAHGWGAHDRLTLIRCGLCMRAQRGRDRERMLSW